MYLPSERQDLILSGGTGSDQGWTFLNNKITLPQEQAPKIITKIHQSLHIGPKALYRFIQPLCYSSGLQQTLEQVHKTCVTCSKVSSQGSLRPQLRYLLTFVDTFSGLIEAFPTSWETADLVASLLTQETIPRFGLPATIQSDNGPAFIAPVVQLVAKPLNISWKLHLPYHPQSLGKVERAHGILKDHLAKLTIEVKLSWHTLLSLALAQIQATPWEPTGLSPFVLLYSRHFLVSHNFPSPTFPIYLFSATYSGSMQTTLSLLFWGLETHTQQHPLQPGDSVLLWELQPGSLQPRWSGPHIVILTTPMAAKLLGHTPWYHVSPL
ncbi:Gag-Pol polyprotein [Plecturocebus cupreus]